MHNPQEVGEELPGQACPGRRYPEAFKSWRNGTFRKEPAAEKGESVSYLPASFYGVYKLRSGRQVRTNPLKRFRHLSRRFPLPPLQVKYGKRIQKVRVFRLQEEGLLQGGFGLGIAAQLLEQQPQVIVDTGPLWHAVGRLLKKSYCSFVLFHFHQQKSQGVIDLIQIRVRCRYFPQQFFRFSFPPVWLCSMARLTLAG